MNNQEQVLEAIETIIDQFGKLRNNGVPADAWHRHMHDLRTAAWAAYYAQKAIVEKQQVA